MKKKQALAYIFPAIPGYMSRKDARPKLYAGYTNTYGDLETCDQVDVFITHTENGSRLWDIYELGTGLVITRNVQTLVACDKYMTRRGFVHALAQRRDASSYDKFRKAVKEAETGTEWAHGLPFADKFIPGEVQGGPID